MGDGEHVKWSEVNLPSRINRSSPIDYSGDMVHPNIGGLISVLVYSSGLFDRARSPQLNSIPSDTDTDIYVVIYSTQVAAHSKYRSSVDVRHTPSWCMAKSRPLWIHDRRSYRMALQYKCKVQTNMGVIPLTNYKLQERTFIAITIAVLIFFNLNVLRACVRAYCTSFYY